MSDILVNCMWTECPTVCYKGKHNTKKKKKKKNKKERFMEYSGMEPKFALFSIYPVTMH